MFTFIRNLIEANKKTLRNNVGATMIEYALVLAGVAVIATAVFATDGAFGTAVKTKINSIGASL